MSLMKIGRSQPSHGKRPLRSKKVGAPKREWVSTVNDLSVYKSTTEELSHRREIHKSHNTAVAQWELKEKALRRHLRHGSPSPLDQASRSIIREVFSDQLLLQDVLARSDRAMAVVKDLFGDAPRRQTGYPSLTMAPDCDSELPVGQKADTPTQLSLLRHSMMNQQALNELEVSDEDHGEEEACPTVSANVNLVHRANLRKMKTKTVGRGAQRLRAKPNSKHQGLGYGVDMTPCAPGRAPDPEALNATVAVQRVRSRQSQSETHVDDSNVQVSQVANSDPILHPPGRSSAGPCRPRKSRGLRVSESSGLDSSAVLSLSGNQSSLGLLQAMLGQVEADLDSLGVQEPERDGQPPAQAEAPHTTQGLTGFSVALVSTLGRLVQLLKQREEETQREVRARSRLEEEVKDQRGLIDALTAESLALREESAALQAGLQQHTAELEQRLDMVVLALGGLGLLGGSPEGRREDSTATAYQNGPPVAEQDPRGSQVAVCPAFLLSPPRQRDNLPYGPVLHPGPPPQGFPSLGHGLSHQNVPGPSNPPSTSFSPPTSDPGRCHFSQDAMLAEIALLAQQNSRLQAQLHRPGSFGSSVSGSPDGCTQQRGSFSSSAGRTTPQGAADRRASAGSAGRETEVKRVQLDGGEHRFPEAAVSGVAAVSSVEQRLLELNRQSAVARSRLLELIEQQKHCASAVVSPSVSPIPPSAFSPNTAGTRTPEAFMLLPDPEPSQASGRHRRHAAEASVQSGAGGRTKADELREGEGWFALSAHVR